MAFYSGGIRRKKGCARRGSGAAAFSWILFALTWEGGRIGASAAFEELTMDARAAAMGSVSFASRGAAHLSGRMMGVEEGGAGSIRLSSLLPYGLRELALHSADAVFFSRRANFGFSISSSGRTAYRETACAVGGSVRTRAGASVGASLRVLNLSIDRYGSWTGLALDAAVGIPLGDRWTFGFSGTNLNHACVERRSPVPQTTRIGFLHVPAEDLTLAFEIEKEARYPAGIRCGMEWAPLAGVALRWGCGRGPSQSAYGFGLARKRFGFDYACTVHPSLGATHQTTLRFRLTAGK